MNILFMGFKRFSTERIIKAVTYELTENDEWSVKGKFMGECWYRDCCVLEITGKKRCNVGENMFGDAKIRKLLGDQGTQRIMLDGGLMGME